MLGRKKIATVLAGQVFDRSPERKAIEEAAVHLGVAESILWERAQSRAPLAPDLISVYAQLLAEVVQGFFLRRYHSLQEHYRHTDLHRAWDGVPGTEDGREKLPRSPVDQTGPALEKLLELERIGVIGRLGAAIAHESRNALQRAQSAISILSLRLDDRPEELELLNRLQNAQDELHRLLIDVRQYGAPLALERGLCQPSKILGEILADFPERQPLPYRIDDDSHCFCFADPENLKKVFRTLLADGLRYAEKPRLVVEIKPTSNDGSESTWISLRSNGSPFTAMERSNLFEPFLSSEKIQPRLSLALCKRLVEAHDGQIEAGDGPTSSIYITLPRRKP